MALDYRCVWNRERPQARSGETASVIPVLVTVDCEPDEREPRDGTAAWAGFERVHALLSAWRPRLAAATGRPARYGWYWRADPQIAAAFGDAAWGLVRYRAVLEQATAAGDEIGLHPHGWRPTDAGWLVDHGDPSWIEHCVRMAFAAFEDALGRPCRSVRFGDGWLNAATLALCQRLGARYDLTLEPGRPPLRSLKPGERDTGGLPDRRGMARHPLRLRPASGPGQALWLIPVATAALPPVALLRAVLASRRLAGHGMRQVCRQRSRMLPLYLDAHPALFRPMLAAVLGASARPHAGLALRTDAGRDPARLGWVEGNLAWLLRCPWRHRFAFATPAEALALLGLEPAGTAAAAGANGGGRAA